MNRPRLVLLLLAASAALAGAAVARSASPPPQQSRAPVSEGLPGISGTPQVGYVLHAHPGRWTGAAGFTYRWQRCNANGAHCTMAPARQHRLYATSTLKLTKSDVGHRMRLSVTARNRWGKRTTWSHVTAKIRKAGSPNTPGSGGSGGSGRPNPGTGFGSTSPGSGGSGGSGHVNLGTGQSVGFWLAWDSSMQESQIQWNALTQVDLFALETTNGTGLDTTSLGIDNMNVHGWVQMVHQHDRLALITIGGISDQNWHNACNDTNRSGFVSNLVNYMKANGFDGVDLDVEDGAWTGMLPPVAPWSACVQAIAKAAHATTTAADATPIVSTDVDQTWMAPYVGGFASYPDQFNLMGYQSNCDSSCMVQQIQAMQTKGKVSSLSRMTIGMDADQGDNGMTVTSEQCGVIAKYAADAGLGGVMLWTLQGDGPSHPCLDQIAPYVTPPQ